MRSFAPLCIAILVLSGCTGAPPAATESTTPPPTSGPATMPTGPSRNNETVQSDRLTLNWTANQTVLIPLRIEAPVSVIGDADFDGPTYVGFSIDYIVRDPKPRLASHIANNWEVSEFAQRKRQDNMGFTELCWSGRERTSPNDDACELRGRPQSPWESFPVQSRTPLPAGEGYLLISAELGTYFEVRLNFSKPVVQGTPIPLAEKMRRYGAESFDSNMQDIVRCVNIGWCGTILEGHLETQQQENRPSLVTVFGYFRAGSYLTLCWERSSMDRDCFAPTPQTGFFTMVYEGVRTTDDTPRLFVNASSPPWNASAPATSNFVVRVHEWRLDLPERHPLSS